MNKIIAASAGVIGLTLIGGIAFAQEHSHGAHDHEATSQMPTMENCRAMHDEMMGESSDHHDETSRQAMMENMDEASQTRMRQCHQMMQNMHAEEHSDTQASEGHDHESSETEHQH